MDHQRMKRTLSQPLMWMRSSLNPTASAPERDRSTTQENLTIQTTGNNSNKPGVRWDDHSASEDEQSPRLDQRSKAKQVFGRRFSLLSSMTGSPRPDRDDAATSGVTGGPDIGSCVKTSDERDRFHCTSTSTIPRLEKRGIQFCAVFAGRGSPVCAKYLNENLQVHFADALDKAVQEDLSIDRALVDAFTSCDKAFSFEHPLDTSGSCAVVSVVKEGVLYLAWTGEARAVFGMGNDVKESTWDHQPSNESERKRILSHGGLITGGKILGVLSASRGFGENDVKNNFTEGVFIATPTVITVKLDAGEEVQIHSPSNRTKYLILASQSVFSSVATNESACKIVNRALQHSDGKASVAAGKLARHAFRKCQEECSVVVIAWNDPASRSRSSSVASWRSLRSFSTHEDTEEGVSQPASPL